MRLYNTLSREIEPLRPRDGAISIYVCGVTPYDVGHLGHCLTYLTYDVIRRRLESEGVRVRHVQNITDVDDDIIRKAKELGETPEAVTERNVALFDRDMAALNALPAHAYPKVSGTMPRIIELVGRLIDQGKGYARAEVDLAKAMASDKVDAVKLPAILLAVALLFLIAGVVVFCMTIALALATLIGPLAGGLAATLVAFAIAGGLAMVARNKLDAKP